MSALPLVLRLVFNRGAALRKARELDRWNLI